MPPSHGPSAHCLGTQDIAPSTPSALSSILDWGCFWRGRQVLGLRRRSENFFSFYGAFDAVLICGICHPPPMSYAVDGQQYVVTAAGGHGSFGTKNGDYVIAYTLAN